MNIRIIYASVIERSDQNLILSWIEWAYNGCRRVQFPFTEMFQVKRGLIHKDKDYFVVRDGKILTTLQDGGIQMRTLIVQSSASSEHCTRIILANGETLNTISPNAKDLMPGSQITCLTGSANKLLSYRLDSPIHLLRL